MAAFFDDPPVLHHDDAVSRTHSRQPVSDEDAGGALQDQIERLLDLPFGEGINAGGGLIQNEDGRLLHQHAHQRHQLPLTHRKPRPAFAHLRIQPLRQRFQPFTPANAPRQVQYLRVPRVSPRVADVLRHRAREQERHLRHHSQPPAVILQVKTADIATIDQDAPLLKLVEARDELGHRALARAGVPHHCQVLAGADLQAEVAQHLFSLLVMERDVVEHNPAGERWHGFGGGLHHRGGRVNQREHAFRSRKPILDRGPEGGQVHDGEKEAVEAEDEQVPGAYRHHPFNHAVPARQHHHRGSDHRQRVKRGEDHRERQSTFHVHLVRGLVGIAELLVDAAFLPEILGYRDAADGLFDGGVHVGHGAHALTGDTASDGAVRQPQHKHDGHQREHVQRQPPLNGQQHNGQDERFDEHAGHIRDQRHQFAKIARIRGDARNDLARRELVVKGKVVPYRGGVSICGELGHHLGDGCGSEAPQPPVEKPDGQPDEQHRPCHQQRAGERRDAHQQVHAAAHDDRQQRARARHQQREDRDQHQPAPLRFEIAHNAPRQVAILIGAVVLFRVE
ncbi:MAG: hypothetical protein BWX54_02189 [Verrucomicrobia bacterium ADurb.Bin018]|nr:MAG: hypothetical protein BWX54_02189 [Verrucomicrobia bacterium ADurb.Bin018]